MPRKVIIGIIIGAACTLAASYYLVKPKMYVTTNIKVSEEAQWVTLSNIEESLKDTPPMNVGFDIDDTLLFPKVAFDVYFNKLCPHDNIPHKPTCKKSQKFWDLVNRTGHLSPAKEIGKQLIAMHKKRGDKIFFITAREQSVSKPETMTATLRTVFNLTEENSYPAIYLGGNALDTSKPLKSEPIIKHNIKLFYGDSDADIAAAKVANIRGIRVIRAPNSQDNHDMPTNGLYGEEVIIGSDV